MAFFVCGTRDKLNARPAGATRHFVDDGSLFGTGLIILDVRRSRLIWDGGIPRPPGRRPRPAASLRSLRAALENASRFLSSAPCRVRIPAFGSKKARYRIGNELFSSSGAPNGIRTRDIHLERVASLAARRWGQRERV